MVLSPQDPPRKPAESADVVPLPAALVTAVYGTYGPLRRPPSPAHRQHRAGAVAWVQRGRPAQGYMAVQG